MYKSFNFKVGHSKTDHVCKIKLNINRLIYHSSKSATFLDCSRSKNIYPICASAHHDWNNANHTVKPTARSKLFTEDVLIFCENTVHSGNLIARQRSVDTDAGHHHQLC